MDLAGREGRVARQHRRVGVACGERSREVEGRGIAQVLLHAGKTRADADARLDAARIHAPWPKPGPGAADEGRLTEAGMEHAAELGIGGMAARADDHGLAGLDVEDFRVVLDVAVAPVALERLAVRHRGAASRSP